MLFVVFVIFPAVWGLWISLHRYDFTLPNKPFIGLDNYTSLINGSSPWASVFWEALRNTLLFTVLSAPLLLVVPLAVAMVLNGKFAGRNLFRAVYFAPYVLGVAVIAVLWRYLLDTNVGLINYYLGQCDPLAHQPAVGVDLHRRGDRVVDVGLQLRHLPRRAAGGAAQPVRGGVDGRGEQVAVVPARDAAGHPLGAGVRREHDDHRLA